MPPRPTRLPATVGEALELARAAIDHRDAHVLLRHASGLSEARLIAFPETPLDTQAAFRFVDLLQGRTGGEPVAYLTGHREFYGLDFHVTPAVLIPRPETELLVDCALEILLGSHQPAILDLGTGSGCLAITLARLVSGSRVTGVDASSEALAVAADNGRRLEARVRWLQGDWYGPLAGERFTLIVANPPYIASGDVHLEQGDLLFEPRGALTDEADGLSALRTIVGGASEHLVPGGWLLVEHGWDQGPDVGALFEGRGFTRVESRADLAGHPRVTLGQWAAS